MERSRTDANHTALLHRAWEQALDHASAERVEVTDDSLIVDLTDGRTITTPIVWFPRLSHATPAERDHVKIVGAGAILEWPELDEGVEVAHLLLGWSSNESQASLKRWLEERERSGKKA